MTDWIKKQVGRLAMRVEGEWWVAYYALPDTMEDALELGKVRMTIVIDQDRKNTFMDIMRGAIGDILESQTGERPDWTNPYTAPEHERAGRS